jgi:hypothetical protein
MLAALRRLSVSKGLVLALALASVLLATPARADDAAQAKELFQQGTTLFNVGEFDKAIEAWQDGYKAKPDPGFLFNIAQAYRLKGDNQKAIFFYRGYLRNSPKAANRADVEARIAALQKAVNDKASPPVAAPTPTPVAPSLVVPPPVTSSPPPAPAPRPAAVTPPPIEAPPLPAPMSETPAPPAPVETPAPPAGPNRPVDLGVGLGFDAWTSGVRGSTQPSFAFDLAAGYTFGNDVTGPASFRLGLFYGYTFLSEPSSKVGFSSFLVEPSVRVRLVDRRLYLTGGLGLGALAMSNVKSGSTLLAIPPKGQNFNVNGTQGAFELRAAVGLQVQLTPAVVLSATPALSDSPKKPDFYGAIGRFELMFGVAYLM